MKLKIKKIRILLRAITPSLVTIVISAFTATMVTLIFYPLQKNIDYRFWRKEYNIVYKEKIWDKRLHLIDELTITAGKFDYCAVQTAVFIEKSILTKEIGDCFSDSFIKLGSLLVQIDIYYLGTLKQQINEFGNFINSYQSAAKKGDDPSELSRRFQIERDKLLQAMVTSIKKGIIDE